jgi:hypothetical protein
MRPRASANVTGPRIARRGSATTSASSPSLSQSVAHASRISTRARSLNPAAIPGATRSTAYVASLASILASFCRSSRTRPRIVYTEDEAPVGCIRGVSKRRLDTASRNSVSKQRFETASRYSVLYDKDFTFDSGGRLVPEETLIVPGKI